jgi:hypothetical protein
MEEIMDMLKVNKNGLLLNLLNSFISTLITKYDLHLSDSYNGKDNPIYVRLEVFTEVTILIMIFWVESPWGLIGRSRRFGETCCLQLQT